jgi:hypothetical protein
MAMFLSKGADLFYDTLGATSLLKSAIHENGYFSELRNSLEHIPSLDTRIRSMSMLSELCREIASHEGYYYQRSAFCSGVRSM